MVRQVLDTLNRSIDFNLSQETNQLTIRSGFHFPLDQLREIYGNLEGVLTNAAHEILQEVPLLNRVSVEYVPQIGYLVAVDMKEKDFLVTDQFHFIYGQGDTYYYKNKLVYALDDEIGDIQANISDCQKALILQVEDELLEAEPQLQQLSYLLGTLDAIASLGVIAKEMDFTRPEITDDGVIAIKGGRHPLQEMTVDRFVPNDVYITSDKNIALITGPNGSGKSVYLKQVGLLVYLAHIGSWLPCEKAIITLTDRIFTRISSVESSVNPLSAFALDLGQMSRLLAGHTSRSLCLVDEFGKGTAPLDGVALLASTINYFIHNVQKPKVMFVLHFTEVLHKDLLDPQPEGPVTVFRMEMHQTENELTEDADGFALPAPLYRLQLGIAPSSEGIACARLAGVVDAVIDRAQYVKETVTAKRPIKPNALYEDQLLGGDKGRSILSLFLGTADWNSATAEDLAQLRTLIS